jgi:hypothetical protein
MISFAKMAVACGLLLLAAAPPVLAEDAAAEATSEARWTVNVAKVKPGMLETARRYYEAGWLPARREALRRGIIKSFRLLAAPAETEDQPEFVLITEFADAASYREREANFDQIFADLGIPSPIMIDGKGRADIFASVGGIEDYREAQ